MANDYLNYYNPGLNTENKDLTRNDYLYMIGTCAIDTLLAARIQIFTFSNENSTKKGGKVEGENRKKKLNKQTTT